MTPDGYCTMHEASLRLGRHDSTVSKWAKKGKIELTSGKIINGHNMYLFSEIEAQAQVIFQDLAQRYKKRHVLKPRKDIQYKEKMDHTDYELTPIVLPKVMREPDIQPYRRLAMAVLLNAATDMSCPDKIDKRNNKQEGQELTRSRAQRFLTGQSEPEMLQVWATLAGIPVDYIKEKARNIEQFPTPFQLRLMMRKITGRDQI